MKVKEEGGINKKQKTKYTLYMVNALNLFFFYLIVTVSSFRKKYFLSVYKPRS